jgi:hypothetical protein
VCAGDLSFFLHTIRCRFDQFVLQLTKRVRSNASALIGQHESIAACGGDEPLLRFVGFLPYVCCLAHEPVTGSPGLIAPAFQVLILILPGEGIAIKRSKLRIP